MMAEYLVEQRSCGVCGGHARIFKIANMLAESQGGMWGFLHPVPSLLMATFCFVSM